MIEIDWFILARTIHVLALVHWIGAVAVVTTIVLPNARRLTYARDAIESFETFERRFAPQARVSVLLNVKRTYALAYFTVEWRADKWFFWKTARYGDKEEKRGLYSSLASVTLMIARQMKRELMKRDSVHQLPE